MKNSKSHLKFSNQERSGIFFLLLIIIIIQTSFWLLKKSSNGSFQSLELDKDTQIRINSLKDQKIEGDSLVIYPFNPNFISDYKGYSLGMSIEEIDRLQGFRAQNKYVNSKEEFQKVTRVSDSLLNKISPYFKFPEWAKGQGQSLKKANLTDNSDTPFIHSIKDLNQVTIQELKNIQGIGEVLSERIIKFRDRLGGFLLDDQLNDVYGLEPDVIERVLERYRVLKEPVIKKININTASAQELSKIGYISRSVAEGIIRFREEHGEITSFEELSRIENFPADRIDRFPLYLSLKK